MKNRIFLFVLLAGVSFAAYAEDCIAVTSASSISCWGSAYVPFANEMQCWDINLNVNKPIKIAYTVDLERVSAFDYFYIYIIGKTKRATFQNETSKTSLFSLPFFSYSFDLLNIN